MAERKSHWIRFEEMLFFLNGFFEYGPEDSRGREVSIAFSISVVRHCMPGVLENQLTGPKH